MPPRRSPRRALPVRPRASLAVAALTAAVLAACAGRAPAPRTAPGRVALPPAPSAEDVEALRARRLTVPVAGVGAERLTSSFAAARDGGGRLHLAADIMAPRGTPVLSADDGRIWKLRSNALGGITIYATDPAERFVYYYAHLDRYRDGLTEGAAVLRGDTLGYVGTTGNAPPDAPHLHFQVARIGAPGQWWGGTPIDPVPFLREAAGAAPAPGTLASAPRVTPARGEPAGPQRVPRPTVPVLAADETPPDDTLPPPPRARVPRAQRR